MAPSDPESSRKAGTSTNSAGNATNDSRRFSIVMPASRSTTPASASTGNDSNTIRRRMGSPARTAYSSDTTASAAQSSAITGVTKRKPTRYVATKRLGSGAQLPAGG